jgi:hypothetical protein
MVILYEGEDANEIDEEAVESYLKIKNTQVKCCTSDAYK